MHPTSELDCLSDHGRHQTTNESRKSGRLSSNSLLRNVLLSCHANLPGELVVEGLVCLTKRGTPKSS